MCLLWLMQRYSGMQPFSGLQDICAPVGLKHHDAPALTDAALSCCFSGLQEICVPMGVRHHDALALTNAAVLLMHFGVQDACVHVARADQQPQWGQGVRWEERGCVGQRRAAHCDAAGDLPV